MKKSRSSDSKIIVENRRLKNRPAEHHVAPLLGAGIEPAHQAPQALVRERQQRLAVPEAINQMWSTDFMHDQLSATAATSACSLGDSHRFTRPYTLRTNGKAERFIQTVLRECAYVATYTNSAHRQAALQPWMHQYNHHRPDFALGCRPPIVRIPRNNLSNRNS